MPKYKLADLTVELAMPDWMIDERLVFFMSNETQTDMRCHAVLEPAPVLPADAHLLVDSPGSQVYRSENNVHFCYSEDDAVTRIGADSAYADCSFYLSSACLPPDDAIRKSVRDAVSVGIRRLLTAKLALANGFILHASVLKWRNAGLCFSAPSGTGKSTHAHLWQELYPDAAILNGDNGICRVRDGVPRVYGGPWCGSSQEFLNEDVPLAGIVFLEQAEQNSMTALDLPEAFTRLTARCFQPLWDAALMEACMNTAEQMAGLVQCWLLRCRPDHDAVRLVKECLGL